jgi:rubrerythrin
MTSTITLVADSLSALAPVRVWECLCCGKRWATDREVGCPYCSTQKEIEDREEYPNCP